MALKVGKPVDILRDTRPKMSTGAELKNGQLFTSAGNSSLSMITFDYVPQGEYLVDMGVTRTSGVDGVLIGIVVDGRPCCISLDCFIDEGRGGSIRASATGAAGLAGAMTLAEAGLLSAKDRVAVIFTGIDR